MKEKNLFIQHAKIEYPIICGAMYPCSNPELVAAVSQSGGLGVVQPLSLTYVFGYEYREGLRTIKKLTSKPFGVNILVEQSSKVYEKRMNTILDISLEEGCRFFITALGDPSWVVKKVKEAGGFVYHDVTEKKWALKAIDGGIDGIICVNNRAGGHAGKYSPKDLYEQLKDLHLPLICAGGVSTPDDFKQMLNLGYCGVQMGTRFIATFECRESNEYKNAILRATKKDIVLTERVTGIPLSVINTPYVKKIGTTVNPFFKYLLLHRWTKKAMRIWYGLSAIRNFKKFSSHPSVKDYWQAGKSVEGITSIKHVSEIIREFTEEKL